MMSKPIRDCITLFAVIFLGACTATVPRSVPVVERNSDKPRHVLHVEQSEKLSLGERVCVVVLRDLSVSWSLRDYWCDLSTPSFSRKMMDRDLMMLNIEQTQRRLARLKQKINTVAQRNDVTARRIKPYLDKSEAKTKPRVIQPIQPSQDNDASDVAKNAGGEKQRIWFAPGREILGPQGRQKTRAIIDLAQNAQRVTLRGYLEEGEFSLADPLDAERRSVGRSLSVRELWRTSGVDTGIVSILHHIPPLPQHQGRYVEVVIYE